MMYSRDGKTRRRGGWAVAARINRSRDGGRIGFVDNRDLSRMTLNAQGRSSQTVQRRIFLDGQEAPLQKLLSQAKDAKERVILANWGWSDTKHNFESRKNGPKARQRLIEAIASAKSQAKDVSSLYSASNLMFLTKASGRLPTLYFRSGNESGRIRQQHGGGPRVVSETNKIDYFFSDESQKKKFHKAAKYAMDNGKKFKPRLSKYSASLVPGADNFHFEVTFKGGGKIKKIHMSGGKIDNDISKYDDTRIKSIYLSAIGFTT